MTRSDRARKLKRAQAHGPQQEQRRQDAMERAHAALKKAKKGAKHFAEFMQKEGYRPTKKGTFIPLPKEARSSGALKKS
jgi:4-alpha-glucanotransferase